MAKRKRGRPKKTKAPSASFSIEVIGLILVLIGIIGLGVFGPVGNIIKMGGIVVFGVYYNILMILLVILGGYMLIYKKTPNFFKVKLIGLYLILISFLSLMSMNLLISGATFQDTFTSFFDTFKVVISDNYLNLSNTGGGVVGFFFGYIFMSLFSKIGAYIVIAVLAVAGLVLIFNISIADLFESIKDMLSETEEEKEERKRAREEKRLLKEEKRKEKDAVIESEELPDEDPNKIVIKSVSELQKNKSPEMPDAKPAGVVESIPEIRINSNYKLPELDQVLDPLKKKKTQNTDEFIKKSTVDLQKVLYDFQIIGKVVEVHEGPTVTQFEVAIKNGTKVSRITSISKEIALALSAKDVRIEAPIPGKSTVGIEIPNKEALGVPIREVIEVKRKEMESMHLPVSLGKDINGTPMIEDLAKTPHLLVAGSTGSGKSVCINSFLASLLINKRPDEVKIVLVDPKKVELSNYNGVPHLLCPVVTDPKKASIALQNIVREMEKRYETFADEKVKNIEGYNQKMASEMKKHPDDNTLHLMTYIVVIIDELADLMLVASKEVEDSIMRITQMARAAGIHLIVATQRPSTDVITGVVKANIPSRISFSVASQIDSRTILDGTGAEKLLGKGDMLYKPMGANVATRIQGNFISEDEIERVIKYVCKEQVAQYDETITQVQTSGGSYSDDYSGDASEEDALYNEIVEFAISTGKISASLIQRKYRLGYNRAARIIDQLEERGIIGPPNGSKPREVLVKLEESDE